MARDGVAEALLVATTTKHEEVGSNTGTLCAHCLAPGLWLVGRLRHANSAEGMNGQGWLRLGCHMFSHGAQFI